MSFSKLFARMAGAVAHATGTPGAFLLCVAVVIVWAVSGPLFQFSDTWQLVINTGTTIVTFLMVFLIQNTQNRDGAAIQIKLDELILTSKAENDFIGIEKLTDKELELLRARCLEAARKTEKIVAKADEVLHARRSHHKKPADPDPATTAASSTDLPPGVAEAIQTGKSRAARPAAAKAAPRRKPAPKKAT